MQLGDHLPPRLEAIQAAKALGHRIIHRRGRRHDVDQRQVVAHADLVIVEVVRGRDLHASGAEFALDVRVRDDRNTALRERQSHARADARPVTLVLGVHGHGGIAEQGLWTGGGDHQIGAAGAFEGIADVP